MELADSFGVSVNLNSGLIDPHDNTGRKKADFDISIEEDVSINKKYIEMTSSGYSKDDHELLMKIGDRPDVSDKGLYCDAGRSGFAVNWDGVMVPCLTFPRDVACGYPLRDGFKHAWNEVNEVMRNYEVPEACHHCELNTKCHYCPMAHQKVAAKHLCDPDYCNHVKALFKAYEKES